MLLCTLCSGQLLAEQSDDSVFFEQRSQHVYNSVFGLPVVAPRLVQTRELQVSIEHSNQFAGGVAGDERLVLDGETTRLSLRHRQRLSSCWQWGATLPLISHNGGVFDRAIDDFHKIFGFPDAGRDNTSFNSLTYFYEDGDGVKHDIETSQTGVGDVQLALQYSASCMATADSTAQDSLLRLGIKLPTGDPDKLLGSGEADLFADWQSPIWNPRGRWNTGVAAGLLLTGQSNRFAEQEPLIFYGSLGTQFAASYKLRLIAQLDGHSPFYDSRLGELGDPSINLAVGLRYLQGASNTFELSISEDVAVDTTPDIVLRLAWKYRPANGRRALSLTGK